MDVKNHQYVMGVPAVASGTVDRKQRRALARLGLFSLGAYAAPMLLALRTPAPAPASRLVVAA